VFLFDRACVLVLVGTGSSNLAYPNLVSLTSGTHHIWAHLSVTQSQEKSGLQSQRIRLRPRLVWSPLRATLSWAVNFLSDRNRATLPAGDSSEPSKLPRSGHPNEANFRHNFRVGKRMKKRLGKIKGIG
jgi:hypothetical protein